MESAAVRQRRKKSVPAAQRVLAVLELLMASRKGLALSEIARGLGLPRSTTFYLINTIEECGYIYRTSPRGRYTFTAKLLELASRSLGCLGVREPAAPFLDVDAEDRFDCAPWSDRAKRSGFDRQGCPCRRTATRNLGGKANAPALHGPGQGADGVPSGGANRTSHQAGLE